MSHTGAMFRGSKNPWICVTFLSIWQEIVKLTMPDQVITPSEEVASPHDLTEIAAIEEDQWAAIALIPAAVMPAAEPMRVTTYQKGRSVSAAEDKEEVSVTFSF